MVLLAPEFLDQVGHGRLMAYGDDAEQAAPGEAPPVQPLADGVPADQVEQRGAGQGDEDIGPGQLEVDRIGDERNPGGETHAGVQGSQLTVAPIDSLSDGVFLHAGGP